MSFVECGTRAPRPGQPGMFDVCRRGFDATGNVARDGQCVSDTAGGLFVLDCAACADCAP
jgi:hypothetical protein